MKNSLYISARSQFPHAACLKIFNQEGKELSLAFDNSCSRFEHLSRVEACVFPVGENHMHPESTEPVFDSVALLEIMARHLGYTVTKKD